MPEHTVTRVRRQAQTRGRYAWLAVTTAASIIHVVIGADQPEIAVARNVQVSRRGDGQYGEVLVAADPQSADYLIGCAIRYRDDRNGRTTVVYLSSDGGATWRERLVTDQFADSGDPTCGFGSNGHAYHAVLAIEGRRHWLVTYRSTNRGETWEQTSMRPMQHDGVDREYLVAAPETPARGDRLYLHGAVRIRTGDGTREGNGIGLWRSTDGGRTFEGPTSRMSSYPRYVLGVGNSVVLSDGTLLLLYGEQKEHWNTHGEVEVRNNRPNNAMAELKLLRSQDGGESLEPANRVADWYMPYPWTFSSLTPYLAADSSVGPFRDRVYAVWPDVRGGRSEIYFAYSTDAGRRWSVAQRIDDVAYASDPLSSGPHNFMPALAVNTRGIVGVSWYDRREDPSGQGWRVRFAASKDGGETFLPSVEVSEAAQVIGTGQHFSTVGSSWGGGNEDRPGDRFSVRVGIQARHLNAGDTAGLAADARGTFHPFWIDNRTGTPHVWTASVTVSGSATLNGAEELATLKDRSRELALDVIATRWDPGASLVSARISVRNISPETIYPPVKARIFNVRSELTASIRLVTPNGAPADRRDVIDFSPAIPRTGLSPGRVSAPTQVDFALGPLLPYKSPTGYRFALVLFDSRLFASSVPSKPSPGFAQ